MIRRSVILFGFVLLFSFLSFGGAIYHEGFEEGKGDWSKAGKNTYLTLWVRERHSGKNSLKIADRGPQKGQANTSHIKVEEGKYYRVSIWVKIDPDLADKVRVDLTLWDKNKKLMPWERRHVIVIGETKEKGKWVKLSNTVKIPKGVSYIIIRVMPAFSSPDAYGACWFDDVIVEPVGKPLMEIVPGHPEIKPDIYVEERKMPLLSEGDIKKGFVVFRVNYMKMVFPQTVPEEKELNPVLKIFATPGEYEPVTFCIRALKDLNSVKVKPLNLFAPNGEKLGRENIRVGVVRYLWKRYIWHKSQCIKAPAYIEEFDTEKIPRDTTKEFWLTVHVPSNLKGGIYKGKIELTVDGRKELLPLEVRVLPFKLKEPDYMFWGMYDAVVPSQDYGYDPNFPEMKYRDMREHGMTTVGVCGPLFRTDKGYEEGIKWENGEVKINWNHPENLLSKALNAYKKVGFPRPVVWLEGRKDIKWALQYGEPGSEEFERAYKGLIRAILREKVKRGWPEVVIQPYDEAFARPPGSLAWRITEATVRCLKELEVRTELDLVNYPESKELYRKVYPYTDFLVYIRGPWIVRKNVPFDPQTWYKRVEETRRDGKHIWFYNFDLTGIHPESLRFSFGWYLWITGATGMMNWAYMWCGKGGHNPYDDFATERGNWIHYYPPLGERKGGPSTGWEGAREGVDDYKYLYTLMEEIRRVRSGGDEELAKKAGLIEKEVNERLRSFDLNCVNPEMPAQGRWDGRVERLPSGARKVRGEWVLGNGWKFEDYDLFRWKIAKWIMELKERRRNG